jgi:hypothetical protein
MSDIVFGQENGGVLLFGAVIIFLLYYALARFRRRRLATFMNEKGQSEAFSKASPSLFWARVLAVTCAFIFASIAMMQPQISKPTRQATFSFEEVDEIAFLLDVSASMGVTDTSTHTSRIARAREIIDGVIKNIGGVPLSLSLFAGDLETSVPRTLDYLYFRASLEACAIGDTTVLGTNFFALFETLEKNVLRAERERKVHFILLSDGEDTAGAKKEAILEKVALFPRAGSRIDVVGLGSASGGQVPGLPVRSRLDRNFLELVAQTGQGRSFFEGEMQITALIDSLSSSSLFHKEGQASIPKGESLSAYPLIAALFFLFSALFIPARFRTLVLLCAAYPTSLCGGENFDRAMGYYNTREYNKAAEYFEKEAGANSSPEVRACMLYNRATCALAEKEFSRARKLLEEIDLSYCTSPRVTAAIVQNLAYAILQEATRAPEGEEETLFYKLSALQRKSDEKMAESIKEEISLSRCRLAKKQYSSRDLKLFIREQELIAILEQEPSLLYARAAVAECAVPNRDLEKMDPIGLLVSLDRYRRSIEQGEKQGEKDEIEMSLHECLDAETMASLGGKKSLWNVLLDERRNLFDRLLEDKMKEGGVVWATLFEMRKTSSFKDLYQYYECTKMSQEELFRIAFETPSQFVLWALWEKIGEGKRPENISKSELVALWSRYRASEALAFLLGWAESHFSEEALSYVKTAWQQYRKGLPAETVQFVDALFTELTRAESIPTAKLTLRAIASTLFFAGELAKDKKKAVDGACEFEKMARGYTGKGVLDFVTVTQNTFGELLRIILPKELQSEVEQFLSAEIAPDASSFLYNYYHDRAYSLLEKIAAFLHKEETAKRPPSIEQSSLSSLNLSADVAIRRSQEMQRDDTMFEKHPKEHTGVDRPW